MYRIMDIAARHGLEVIEDCAQAYGATYRGKKVGAFGAAGCLSFFPSKNLGGFGDGGMVLTSNPELAEKVRMLRGHGSKVRYYHDMVGTNSRLDEIQAAVLRVKLRHLEAWNLRRREIAATYTAGLRGTFATPPTEKEGCEHVYHQYTLRAPDRDALQKHMQASGVGAVIYYPVCLHMQKAFSHQGLSTGSLPVSEKAQAEVLSLPMFPELTGQQIETVLGALKAFSPAPAPVG